MVKAGGREEGGDEKATEHFPSAEGRVLEGPSYPKAGGASWRGRECPGAEVCKWGPEDPLKAREFQSALGGSPAGCQFKSLSGGSPTEPGKLLL